MPLVVPILFKAVDGIVAPMRAMGNSVTAFAAKAEAGIQRADRAMNKYTSVLNHAQKELLQTVSVAAIAYKGIQALEFGFDAVKEYDAAITKLQTNFRLSDSALVPFKEGIMDVAKESYKSATEVSEVYNIIGSKNRDLLNQPKALGEMAKSAISLSEGLKTELIPTAEALTGLMKGFNLKDSAQVADVIAGASSSGGVKGLALMEALKGMSQEAKHANMSLSQTAAAIEFIDSKAQDGGESVTAFKRSLLKFESSPMMKGYHNASGQFDFKSAVGGVRQQLDKMKPQAQELYLKSIGFDSPKTSAVSRALFAPGALSELAQYETQTKATGTAEAMAAKNTQTLEIAMERVKAAFANAFISSNTVGTGMNHLKGILVYLYEHMNGIVDVAIKLTEAFIIWKGIVLATTIYTRGLTFATGALAVAEAICRGEVNSLAKAQGFYEIATLAATDTTEGLTLAMAANPAMALVTAFTLLAVAIYGAYKINEKMNDSLEDTANQGKSVQEVAKKKAEDEAYKELDAHRGNIQSATSTPEQVAARLKYKNDLAEIDKTYKTANIAMGKDLVNENNARPGASVAYNPKLLQQQMINSNTTTTQKQNVAVTFGNLPKGASVTTDNDMVKINTTSTMGQGYNNH